MWNPFKWIKKPFSWAWGRAKRELAIMLMKRIINELGMQKIWAWLNNKKMFIGFMLGSIIALLQGIAPEIGNPQWISTAIAVLIWISGTFFGVGGLHKIVKKLAA